MRFVVLMGALALYACSFDTSGIASLDAADTEPDSAVADAGVTLDAPQQVDALAPDAPVPDAMAIDAPPPDADPCTMCDDGVACTVGACDVGGICQFSDNCGGNTTCNFVTGDCDGNVMFRQGLDTYTGTQDTFLSEDSPTSNAGSSAIFEWDNDDPSATGRDNVGLLLFGNLFGPGANQVPTPATILSATLTLTVVDQSAGPEAADIHEVLVDWAENSVTWNSFGGDPGVQADEYSASIGTAPATLCPCPVTIDIDVTASLQGWLAAPSTNRGWVFLPNADDGTQIASSENATAANRPRLTVVYSVPAP